MADHVVESKVWTEEGIVLTPARAKQLIDNTKGYQRPLNRRNIDRLKSIILSGKWKYNGEPLILGPDGSILQGQHRCHACWETGVSIVTDIKHGINPDTYHTMDNGVTRQMSDAVRAAGYTYHTILTPAVRLLYRYEHDMLLGMKSYRLPLFPAPMGPEILQMHPCLEDSARKTFRAGKLCSAPGAICFCHYILSNIDSNRADYFFDRLYTGENLSYGDPIMALRDLCMEGRHSKKRYYAEEVIFFVFNAWNEWILGKTIKKKERLVRKEGDNLPTPKRPIVRKS